MFGVNSVKQLGQIAEGHYNEITGKELSLSESRMNICMQCPLCSNTRMGYVCDSKKCIDGEGNTYARIDTYNHKDVTCGCGCRLQAKTRVRSANCVLGKW